LADYPLVQVFEECNRLPRENLAGKNDGDICHAFAAITPKDPGVLQLGNFHDHGHTGYGWAARRDLLDEFGLYEYAIIGSGDHYIAHAACGDYAGPCIRLMTDNDARQMLHFADWARPFAQAVQSRIAAAPGQIYHLWHGDPQNRRYLLRNRELTQLGYNPFTDLTAAPGKPLEWHQDLNNAPLVSMLADYFSSRNEDSPLLVATA
jgi:hypothetical protein